MVYSCSISLFNIDNDRNVSINSMTGRIVAVMILSLGDCSSCDNVGCGGVGL